jgi:hypothetical protein
VSGTVCNQTKEKGSEVVVVVFVDEVVVDHVVFVVGQFVLGDTRVASLDEIGEPWFKRRASASQADAAYVHRPIQTGLVSTPC